MKLWLLTKLYTLNLNSVCTISLSDLIKCIDLLFNHYLFFRILKLMMLFWYLQWDMFILFEYKIWDICSIWTEWTMSEIPTASQAIIGRLQNNKWKLVQLRNTNYLMYVQNNQWTLFSTFKLFKVWTLTTNPVNLPKSFKQILLWKHAYLPYFIYLIECSTSGGKYIYMQIDVHDVYSFCYETMLMWYEN